MTETQHKSFIETLFPTDLLNAQVTREKGGNAFKGVHRWYSRKPLSFSRACVLGAVLPDTLTLVEFLQLLGMTEYEAKLYWNNKGQFMAGHKSTTRLFDRTPSSTIKETIQRYIKTHWGKDNLTILDPFAGGGSIPFEALRLGLNTIANDLNPVAVTTMKAAIEFPFKFGKDLQQDINHYVHWIGQEAQGRLKEFFPAPKGQEVQNYLWAHTVPCEFCETVVPLCPNWWVDRSPGSKKKGQWCAIRPVGVQNFEPAQKVQFELIVGKAGKGNTIVLANGDEFDPAINNTMSSGTGTCPSCKRHLSRDYILGYASQYGLGHQMYAVAYREETGGLQFRLPEDKEICDFQLLQDVLDDRRHLIPDVQIPWGVQFAERSSLIQQGITSWDRAFNPRQLLTLVTYLELIHEAIQDMNAQGWAEEKKEAVASYLALVLDRCVDKNCRLSRWHGGYIKVESASATHALNLMWNYPESEGSWRLWPWCAKTVSQEYSTLVSWLNKTVPTRPPPDPLPRWGRAGEGVQILQESATALFEISDRTIDAIVTDPPYYDTIQYSELSDFFYVWQKRALEPLYLSRMQAELTNKDEEAVANSARHREKENPKQASKADYEEKMRHCFAECHRVLQDQGILVVQFNHKDSGAWDALSQALMEAGFMITATWSVNTEAPESLHQADKNSVASTIALTCRKRQNAQEGWWSEVEPKVREKVAQKVTLLEEWGMEGVDLLLGCFGPALEVFSAEYPVFHQDETPVRPEEIFQITRQTLIKHLFQKYTQHHEMLLDKETQFYVIVWALLQAQSFDFDEARQIALAVGVEIKDLERRLLIKKDKGNLAFLSPEQRLKKRAFNLDAEQFISSVDILHVLFCTAQERGSQGVIALVDRMGWANDEKILQLLEVAYQVLPQTEKHPLKKEMQAFILWVEAWNRYFNDRQIWDKIFVEEDKQVDILNELWG